MMKNRTTSCLLFAVTAFVFNVRLWNLDYAKAYGIIPTHNINNNNKQPPSIKRGGGISKDMVNKQEPNVVVCGGGPGGLLASILLNNIGIKSTVVEQAAVTNPWGIKSYTLILNDKGKESLDRCGCLESAIEAGLERHFTGIFNPTTGVTMKIPKKSPNLAISRHSLVKCIEDVASDLPNVTLRKGVGVSGVTNYEDLGLRVELEDGTSISATHVIGADGKWSNVRQSYPSFLATMVTCPSSAVHMNMTGIPEGWEENGTYLIKPTNDDCKFYIIASPNCGTSITMVYYDQTVETYPWLAPPMNIKPKNYNEGWKDSFQEIRKGSENSAAENSELSDHMKTLFEEELPAFSALLDDKVYRTAVIKRRVTWLQMEAQEGKKVTYSSEDGRISLIGDAAHAMTPSIGEGCNTALDSAVKLVDNVIATMKEKEETSCTTSTMSLAFMRYGSSRPKECISLQELSASRSALTK